jgi:hypothetical protein
MYKSITHHETKSEWRNLFFVSMTIVVLTIFILINYIMNLINAFAQENDNKGKFIVNLKLVYKLDIKTNNTSLQSTYSLKNISNMVILILI